VCEKSQKIESKEVKNRKTSKFRSISYTSFSLFLKGFRMKIPLLEVSDVRIAIVERNELGSCIFKKVVKTGQNCLQFAQTQSKLVKTVFSLLKLSQNWSKLSAVRSNSVKTGQNCLQFAQTQSKLVKTVCSLLKLSQNWSKLSAVCSNSVKTGQNCLQFTQTQSKLVKIVCCSLKFSLDCIWLRDTSNVSVNQELNMHENVCVDTKQKSK
jgi:hypothetical protein